MKPLPTLLALLLCLSSAATAAEPVFDMHVHLHDGEASVRAYEARLAAHGIEVGGYGAMWFGGPNQAPQGNPDDIARRNDALLTLAAKHPTLRPIATVHPHDGQAALDELARVAGRGVRVLKIHPHTQKFDAADPRVLALVKRAGELGIVVLMDNASIVPGDHEKLFNLALLAPKTKFVFAHLGALGFRAWNILPLARTAEDLFADNIYFDLSAIVVLAADSPIEDEFVWTLRNVGIDHVLLGSDYPQFPLDRTLAALEKLGLTDEEKAKIRSDNAQRLFGW